jgi:hypothetical protein
MKIPALSELSIGQRIALTFIIVLIVLFALALIGYLTGGWDEADAQAMTNSKWDTRLIELDKIALDEAYKTHLVLVWTNWLKDGGPPTRHATGFARARNGYIASMIEIEKREANATRP